MRGLSACLVVGLFLLLAGASAQQHEGFSSSSDFYQLIEDVVAGRDYYAILEITAEQAEQPAELKKAFRALTRRWHPDKNPSPEAALRFRQVVFAYDILSDPVKKAQYEKLVTKGIPWHEAYYGRYAHRYGAPEHDIRWVLFWLITTVTALHYAYRRHRYYLILSRVKLNPTYRHRQAQLRAASGASVDGSSSGKRGKKNAAKQAGAEVAPVAPEDEPEVKLMGIRPPGWRDLVVVRLVLLPWTLGCMLYRLLELLFRYYLRGKRPPPADRRELLRQRLGLSQAEFDEWEREMKEKEEKAARYNNRRYR